MKKDILRCAIAAIIIFLIYLSFTRCSMPYCVINASGDTCYPCKRGYELIGDSCVYTNRPAEIY